MTGRIYVGRIVKVTTGIHAGRVGTITKVNKTSCWIHFSSGDSDKISMDNLS